PYRPGNSIPTWSISVTSRTSLREPGKQLTQWKNKKLRTVCKLLSFPLMRLLSFLGGGTPYDQDRKGCQCVLSQRDAHTAVDYAVRENRFSAARPDADVGARPPD